MNGPFTPSPSHRFAAGPSLSLGEREEAAQPPKGEGGGRPRRMPMIALVAAAAVMASAAIAQAPPAPKPETRSSRPDATGGEALYLEHCAMCHGPNGMGTGLLGRRVQPALLELRQGLPAQYVVLAARQGIGNMPAIPRGEVSDADLKAIADYIAAGPHPQ